MKQCPICQRTYKDDDSFCVFDRSPLQATGDPLLGTVLGGYRIESFLAEGGLGMVYRATHVDIQRPAAVKLIKREFTAEPTAVARFLQEARAVANIRHPNLIDIFDIGSTPDGRVYYVMELLEGRTLSQRMASGRLPWGEMAPLVIETLGAVEAAHAAGIVHRDLKPDNLFLVERPGESYVKVLDFGVAKVLNLGEDAQQRLTRTGMLVGTPQYMAPEQIDGSPVDHRADIYALGVIIYELATGSLPFRANTVGGMLKAHVLEAPPRFDAAKMLDGLPAGLEAVVFKALAKNPDDRYATIHELREDIERLMQGKAPLATQSRVTSPTMIAQPKLPTAAPAPMVTPSTPPTFVPPLPGTPLPQMQSQPPTPPKSRMPLILGGAVVVVGAAAFLLWPRPPPPKPLPAAAVTAPKKSIDSTALRSQALGVITQALKDGDPALRRQALEALAQSRDARTRTLVEPLLGDADLAVRAAAASTLATLGARASIPALREAAGNGSNLSAAEALYKLGDRSLLKPLKVLMKKGDEHARQRAAVILCDGDKDARKLVAQRAASLPHGNPLRLALLGQLARDDEKARNDIVDELEGNGSPSLQIAASESLARLGDARGSARLSQLAQSADVSVKLRAYRALAGLDDQSGFEVFGTAFSDATRPPGERMLAAQGLGASGEKSALEKLAPSLTESDAGVRLAAAGAVLQILAADPRALAQSSLDWATAAINDSSWEVREQAANVLADAAADVAVPLLGKALKDDEPRVRQTAAASLGHTRVPQAVPLLGAALDDKKEEVRMGALRSMGKLGDRSAAPIMAKHLARATKAERVVASGQLAKLGDKSHLSEVKAALKASDPSMRKLAVEEAASDPETQKEATTLALKDSSFEVRLQAALQVGDQSGVPVLQEAVKRGGAEGLRAWAALKKLGVEPTTALDPSSLLSARDRETRLQAVDAAAQLQQPGDFFKRALGDSDPQVRLHVLEAARNDASLLKRALGDSDPSVRAKAGALLSRLSPEPEKPVVAQAVEAPIEVVPTPTPTPTPTPEPQVAVALPDMMPAPVVTADEASKEEGQLAMTSGEIALKSGRIDQAIKELTRAHKLDSKLPVYFSLGEAYRKLGDREADHAKQKDAYKNAINFYGRAHDKRAASYAAELGERLKEK